MNELESFWLVWQPSSGPPTRTHATFESAEDEAKRLAECNPGRQFFILEAMAQAFKPSPGPQMRYTKNHLATCTPPF